MDKRRVEMAQNESSVTAMLSTIEEARGTERRQLVASFVRSYIAPELARHHTFLLESGMLDKSALHPVVFQCLEAIFNGVCINCAQTTGAPNNCGGCIACLTHAPVGRSPTQAGRNILIFEAVQCAVLDGCSIALATRKVSEEVRQGRLNGVDQQVLAARTVLNIYREILKTP